MKEIFPITLAEELLTGMATASVASSATSAEVANKAGAGVDSTTEFFSDLMLRNIIVAIMMTPKAPKSFDLPGLLSLATKYSLIHAPAPLKQRRISQL